ncbi:hypothetical protein BDEG_25908 [Batrachochytrium dendrobatidis JEL423]|uniref:Uncharacterized protein n=1 Tax=Batrachochytrium dendrobatidis (strain JEL423) TaxID=403673 RepID=A0A177WQQ2_BATDL|nr:hypothetical protein BDEG_25908 [Batrachochytrium dendrobatidis JEL423]
MIDCWATVGSFYAKAGHYIENGSTLKSKHMTIKFFSSFSCISSPGVKIEQCSRDQLSNIFLYCLINNGYVETIALSWQVEQWLCPQKSANKKPLSTAYRAATL